MTAKNDITGDDLKSRSPNDAYRDGWDRIFGKKKPQPTQAPVKQQEGRAERKKPDDTK